MCDALVSSIDVVARIPWLESIKAAAALATAAVAFWAVHNWKRQDRAKRHAEFLDDVIETSNAYIVEMSGPLTLADMIRIGMECHEPSTEEEDRSVQGAITYIEKNGVEESKRLLAALEGAQPATIRLRSLAAKGQVFTFPGFEKCYDAITRLTAQHDRLAALASIVGSPTLYWENPEVIALLKKVMAINSHDMEKECQMDSITILTFCRETYGRIYT
jgi:hypothetical protein